MSCCLCYVIGLKKQAVDFSVLAFRCDFSKYRFVPIFSLFLFPIFCSSDNLPAINFCSIAVYYIPTLIGAKISEQETMISETKKQFSLSLF